MPRNNECDQPIHPGRMLLEQFLEPRDMSQEELAASIDVPVQHIEDIVGQKIGLTPNLVIKLSMEFNVRTDFWMNLQSRWELHYSLLNRQEDNVNGSLVSS